MNNTERFVLWMIFLLSAIIIFALVVSAIDVRRGRHRISDLESMIATECVCIPDGWKR